MLILLSPAKALDLESRLPELPTTEPVFQSQADQLAEQLRGYSVTELARLGRISDELAALNAARWAEFGDAAARRPAVLAFNGEAYQGLAAQTFQHSDFEWAQRVLRILSGLYGVLRPLDLISPYRLEMGTRLPNARGKNLYQWWGDQVTEQLATDLGAAAGERVLVNLASAEYFAAVDPAGLDANLISPRFEDTTAAGRRKVISFHAKRARGMMASWLIRHRIEEAARLVEFSDGGYRYDAASSTQGVPVFVR